MKEELIDFKMEIIFYLFHYWELFSNKHCAFSFGIGTFYEVTKT